jgi:hypothetical protein
MKHTMWILLAVLVTLAAGSLLTSLVDVLAAGTTW